MDTALDEGTLTNTSPPSTSIHHAGSAWGTALEKGAPFAAMAGLLAAVLFGFSVHTRQNAASDFKTLYASAWCFVRSSNAYGFPDLANVFAANQVVSPQSWYAHAPVYPPFTLALLAPLTLLAMVPAIYAWIALSALLMAWAIASLTRMAGESFLLTRPWRILLIALAALSPLLSAGLELGNVSVITAALCLLAVTAREDRSPWPPAVGLAAAMLLKPHMALWVLPPLLFLKRAPGRPVALRAYGIGVGIAAAFGVWLVTQPTALPQMQSYGDLLTSEAGAGSMSSGNHAVMEVTAQITSLDSLLGFWLPAGEGPHTGCLLVLALLAVALLWSSWKLREADPPGQLQLIAAWCAFGMIATYHRAHDGTLLLLLLPLVLARLHRAWTDSAAWGMLLLLAGMSFGPAQRTLERLAGAPHVNLVEQILLYRQASFAAFLLALLFTMVAVRHALSIQATRSTTGNSRNAS